MPEKTERIRALNDGFRSNLNGGRVYLTDGVAALSDGERLAVVAAVAAFKDFSAGNDPWGEHDFGSFEFAGKRFFWKIDYYDRRDPDLGAEDPSDETTTERALTIMLAEEY